MPENRFVGDAARSCDRGVASMFAPNILGSTVECLAGLAEGGPLRRLETFTLYR